MKDKPAHRIRGKSIHKVKVQVNELTEHFPQVKIVIIYSAILFILAALFLWHWLTSRFILSLILSILLFVGFVALFWPVFLIKKVQIKGETITFVYRIGVPFTFRISKDLYQVVQRRDEIISFRFSAGNKRSQVSPSGYTNGDVLSAKIMDVFKKKRMTVQLVDI